MCVWRSPWRPDSVRGEEAQIAKPGAAKEPGGVNEGGCRWNGEVRGPGKEA